MDRDDALEIVMSWGGTPQQTELFEDARGVRVGDEVGADFVLPREVIGEPFQLVERRKDEGWVLRIPAVAGASVPGMDLSTVPVEPDGCRRLRMEPGMVAAIELGELAFHVRSTDARVDLPGPAIDWRSYRWVGASFLFHAVLIGIFLLQPPDAGALSIDLDGRGLDRMQYYMAAIERQQPELDESHLQGEAGAATNEGRPMEGEEGAAGAPDERRNTGGGVSVRGPDEERRVPLTAEDVRSVSTLGTIASAALGLSDISSPYGVADAQGWATDSYYGPLTAGPHGFGPGSGGFGMRGPGRGGCPVGATNCGLGTVGVGDLDTIGTVGGCSAEQFQAFVERHGRAGAMDRCSGTSHRVTGSTLRREGGGEAPPRITMGVAEPVGGLSREQVRRIVRRNIAQVRHCYEQGLQQRPDLEGRVSVQFVIQQSGAVMSTQVVNDSLGDGRVGRCVAEAVRRWPFPRSPGVTSVTYPFQLTTP